MPAIQIQIASQQQHPVADRFGIEPAAVEPPPAPVAGGYLVECGAVAYFHP